MADAVRFGIAVGAWAIFTTRLGMWGQCKLRLYNDDTEIGIFSRWFYDVAQFKIAGSNEVTEVWSITPIYFNRQFTNRSDRKLKLD